MEIPPYKYSLEHVVGITNEMKTWFKKTDTDHWRSHYFNNFPSLLPDEIDHQIVRSDYFRMAEHRGELDKPYKELYPQDLHLAFKYRPSALFLELSMRQLQTIVDNEMKLQNVERMQVLFMRITAGQTDFYLPDGQRFMKRTYSDLFYRYIEPVYLGLLRRGFEHYPDLTR